MIQQTRWGIGCNNVIISKNQIWRLDVDYVESLIKFNKAIGNERGNFNKVVVVENSETVSMDTVLVAPVVENRLHLAEIEVTPDDVTLRDNDMIMTENVVILEDHIFTINPKYLSEYIGKVSNKIETMIHQHIWFKIKL